MMWTCCFGPSKIGRFTYFDVELQVLIHGVDVVEDVVDNSGNDSHHIRVVEFAL